MSSSLKCLLTIFAMGVIDFTIGHPQCLDYLPPFTNTNPRYCDQYKPVSCCTNVAAIDVKKRVNKLLKNTVMSRVLRKQCRPYLRDVACTICSPYAAHVFEAETAAVPRIFPSLCHDYCVEFYRNCYPMFFDYYKLNRTGYGENSAETFCKDQMSSDPTYCYPSVIRGPQFTDNTSVEINFSGALRICALPIATHLRNPIAAVHSNDQTGRLFVAEQLGVIYVVTKDKVRLSTPFLNISEKVLTSGRFGDERGLLGLVFHPHFKENGKFYVYYSAKSRRFFDDDGNYISHVSRVSQYLAPSGSDMADASTEQIVITIPQPSSNHNGGQLLFKDNDSLLIFLGDGGGGGDRHGRIGNGLNRTTMLGSVLRINVSSLPYSIPRDNPYVNHSRWLPEIYAYGLRNPWRCSVDRGDSSNGRGRGRIFCGDVGQNRFEEIDIIERGGNYGWRAFEGNSCFDSDLCDAIDNYVPPIHAYPHSLGRSVTGGYVYRGCSFPKLRGLYFFADYEKGTIWTLKERRRKWKARRVFMGGNDICHSGLVGKDRAHYILSFGEDESGELYILATKNPSPASFRGTVYQIIEPERRNSPTQCERRK